MNLIRPKVLLSEAPLSDIPSRDPMIDIAQIPSHFRQILTRDQSPSLAFQGPVAEEAMHHQGGALAETKFIYEPTVRAAFAGVARPRVVSVGLGLGYNEILTAVVSIEKNAQDFALFSFESDPWLRESFVAWIAGEGTCALGPSYAKICQGFGVSESSVRSRLAKATASGSFKIEGALTSTPQLPQCIHAYLWDAFSKKTSPELWDEDFLIQAFQKASPEFAILSTYASHGALKRALKATGFVLEKTDGFARKRGSTRATREPAKI